MKLQNNNTLSNSGSFYTRYTPLVVFIFGLWYFCIRILGFNLEYIPGDFGDSRFINFLFENGHQWLSGNNASFWDGNFMYPFKNTIAISDNMLGTMPIYSIFRHFGFSLETSYQLWWMTICSLNFWSAYYVSKKWLKNGNVAIIIAWIFAFTIFNFGQLNFMQMMIRFMVPITFYAAFKMVDTKNIKYFIIFSFSLVYQFYSVIYTGVFLLYFSLFFILIYALIQKKPFFFTYLFQKKNLKFVLLTSVFLSGAMLWIVSPYLQLADILGHKKYDDVASMLPTFKSFLFPTRQSYAWSYLNQNIKLNTPHFWLHYNFIGFFPTMTLVLIPFLWIYWKIKNIKPSKLILSLTLSVFIIFIFYIKLESGESLYKFLFKLPGMNNIRVLNRFMHVLLFMLLILLGYFLTRIPKKWSIAIFLLVVLDNSFVTDNILREEKAVIQERRMNTIQEIQKHSPENYVAFAIIDENTPFFMTHIDAMLAALHLDFPTINGYSSNGPPNHSEFFREDNTEGLNHWLEYNSIPKESVLIIYRE